jgi:ankyrin repeat protein
MNARRLFHAAFDAAEADDVERIKQLIEVEGFDPDVPQPDRDAPPLLHEACSNGSERVVEYLLGRGVNISGRDRGQNTALYRAAAIGNVNIARQLIAAGQSDPSILNAVCNDGCTAVYAACAGHHVEAAQLLVAAGADVNIPDYQGNTPLMSATARGDHEIFDILLNCENIDTKAQNHSGATALTHASNTGRKAMINRFKQRSDFEKLTPEEKLFKICLVCKSTSQVKMNVCGKCKNVSHTSNMEYLSIYPVHLYPYVALRCAVLDI